MTVADQCAHCGRAVDASTADASPGSDQPVLAPRISWRLLAHEFERSVLNMDRGLLFTLKMLMLQPGRLIRDYLAGRRDGHVKPLWLLMITSAAMILFMRLPGLDGGVLGVSTDLDADVGVRAAALSPSAQVVNDWISRHYTAVTLALLPLEAALFRLVFWRTKGLNYPEWLTIIALLTVQATIIYAVFALAGIWLPQAKGFGMLAMVAYSLFSLVQAFDGYPRWKTLLRGLLAFALFMVLSGIMVSVAIQVHALTAGT